MTSVAEPRSNQSDVAQYATFYVGKLLLGIPIDQVREINRQLDSTVVPHAPEYVRGVINLRGEVVTVVDLARILGMRGTTLSRTSRNVIIHWEGELVGLAVDRVADIISAAPEEIAPTPANVAGVDGRFFKGVRTTDSEIVVILDVQEALTSE